MVWIWIIVAIVVIALISWLLVSRRRSAGGGSGQARVGRHVASGDRPAGAATATATAPAAPSATADQPVFDQEAHEDTPAADSDDTVTQAVPVVEDQPAERGPDETAPAADSDDTVTEAVPVVEDRPAERGAGEDAPPTEGAEETGDLAPTGEPVLHTTGSTGDEQLVASGSAASDAEDARRAEVDATVAAENDDPQVRPADAPPESAAAATQHADAELPETPVEDPAEGMVEAGEEAPAAAPAASAGHTAGYAVDRGTAAPAAPGEPGIDPMTERFGDGAVSPRPDGSAPEGHPIKGNADSMLFHTPDSPRYEATNPAVWFRDEAAATAAGFAHWDRNRRGGAAPTAAGIGGDPEIAG